MAAVHGEIDPALLQGLGLIVTRWVGVEEWQTRFLAFLVVGDQSLMPVITTGASAANVTAWLRTLAGIRFRDATTRERLDVLFTRVDQARAERNGLVHGIWNSEDIPGQALVQTMNFNRGEALTTQLVTLSDLEEVAHEISAIIGEFVYLARTLDFYD